MIKKTVSMLLLVLLLAGAAVPVMAAEAVPAGSSTDEEAVPAITAMTLSSDSGTLSVDLRYPQLSGMADSEAQGKINALFRDAALAALAEGLQNDFELTEARIAYPESPFLCETVLDYEVKYNQDGLLSVVLQDYQYAGGAHGSTVQASFTFDLAGSGEPLTLSDYMKTGSRHLYLINAQIRKAIDQRTADGDLIELEGSAFKTIAKEQDYYLTDGGLVIYMQQYEHFPYAAGIQEFLIPWADLKSCMKADFSSLYSTVVKPDASGQADLTVGDVLRVTLAGNATTGYSWHYRIGNGKILKLKAEDFTPDSTDPTITGSGGTYTWDFQALKKGSTKVTFLYYRDWEGDASASDENTIVYETTVK